MTGYKKGMLIALSITLITLVVLSAGLSQIRLQEGTLFNRDNISELRSLLVQLMSLRELLLPLILIGALIILVWSLVAKKQPVNLPRSKNRQAWLVQIILWVVAFAILRRQLIKRDSDFKPLEILGITNNSGTESIPTQPSPIPDWFVFAFSLVLFILICYIFWRVYRTRRKPEETVMLLTQEAKVALDTLQAGEDLRDVIQRCYFQMARILREQRGIQRKQAMTPREFEQSLIGLGFPGEPIRQLTQLFEAVRYGAKELGEKSELKAISCLDAIVSVGGRMS